MKKHKDGAFFLQPGRPDDGDRDVDAVLRDRAVFDIAGRELELDGRLDADQDLAGVGG